MKAFQMRGYNVVMLCAICYCLYSLKSVKNTYGGVLLLAKLLALTCNFTKSSSSPWMFFAFFKLYKWYQIEQRITYNVCKAPVTKIIRLTPASSKKLQITIKSFLRCSLGIIISLTPFRWLLYQLLYIPLVTAT